MIKGLPNNYLQTKGLATLFAIINIWQGARKYADIAKFAFGFRKKL